MKEFKIGDKVKLNQPMHYTMEKQIEYRKYYDVVMVDNVELNGENIQAVAIDGVKGLIDAGYFDLYIENERDFTIDELVFMQGHLGSMREEYKCRLDLENMLPKEEDSIKWRIKTIEEVNKKISELFKTY